MKKAVVTGMGAISCIGNTLKEITQNLKLGKSGIIRNTSYDGLGMRSLVSGSINLKLEDLIDRKLLRFMSNAAGYSYLAAKQALEHAGLGEDDIQNPNGWSNSWIRWCLSSSSTCCSRYSKRKRS